MPGPTRRRRSRRSERARTGRSQRSRAHVSCRRAAGGVVHVDALGSAADIMMAHPLALQLRNLQSLVEIGVDKNTMVVFPAPLMSTIGELGSVLDRESAAATQPEPAATAPIAPPPAAVNGTRAEEH